MTNFEYAPGRPGFGSKGEDGSAGLQGLAMYFTDYDPVSDSNILNTRIQNNLDLWTGIGGALPSGRTYSTGDLFIDSTGKVYEINAEDDTFAFKFTNLNTGYFTSANVATTLHNYNRYYNLNTSPKYLIDNVFTDGAVAYYLTPDTIYDVNARDFARIEFCNVEQGDYNHFTLFTAGSSDNNALAIVRETDNNTFHIGNLSNTGVLRDVNLTFDVSSLRQTKQVGVNEFGVNTPSGTLLTNYEIQANALFTGAFNTNPASFRSTFGVNDVSISWTLGAFTLDQNVNMDLYFFKDVSSTTSFSINTDASTLRPLVFHNCVSSGSINFTNLETTTKYLYYMNFHKNGWERRSVVKTVTTGAVPYMIVSPTSFAAGSEGYVGDNSIGFDVSSNVAWTAAIGTNPDSFITGIYPTGSAGDASIFVNLSENTDCDEREGTVIISAVNPGGNSPRTITITQAGQCVPVSLNVNASDYTCDITGTKNYQNGIIDVSGMVAAHTYILDISLNAFINNSNLTEIVDQINYSIIFKVDNNIVNTFSGSFFGTPIGGSQNAYYNLTIIGLKDASVIYYETQIEGFAVHQDYIAGTLFIVNDVSTTAGPTITLTENVTSGGAGIICA